MMRLVEDRCSFCGKGKSKVRGRLLIGSQKNKKVFVCADCALKGKELMEECSSSD